MNNTAKFILVVSGFVFVLLFLIVLNSSLLSCNEGDVISKDNKLCEKPDGTTYESLYLLETSGGKVFLWIIIIIFVIILVVYIVKRYGKISSINTTDIGESKKITTEEAEKAIEEYFAKKSKIPYSIDKHNNLIINEQFIRFYRINRPFIKSDKEWRVIKQYEIMYGEYAGIYTSVINLARGAEWILSGDFLWQNTNLDGLKLNENKYPIYQAKTAPERIMERLERSGQTDLLAQMQEQQMQKDIQNFNTGLERIEKQEQQTTPEQQVQRSSQQPRQGYRRPWYMSKRYARNRGYN